MIVVFFAPAIAVATGVFSNSDGRGENKQQSTKSSLPPRPRCRQAAAAKLTTSDRRSESLSLNNGLNICEYLCVYVCVSIPLQIPWGCYLLSCWLVECLVSLVISIISYNPTRVPVFYVLITYSCQHDILIPTYIGMSSLYQVLNSLSAKSILAGEKLVATYSISM